MKKIAILLLLTFSTLTPTFGQSWLRALSGAIKAGQAMTISDKDFADLVRQSVASMDQASKVCSSNSAYTQRLKRLTKGMTSADGIPLNFKVYQTHEVNAFACPDGSIRVYTALMDALTDSELLGVIGHEIGHVALRHSHKA